MSLPSPAVQITRLSNELKESRKRVSQLQTHNDELKAENAQLHDEVRHFEARLSLDKRTQRLMELETALKESEDSRHSTEQALRDIESDFASLSEDYDVLEQAFGMHKDPELMQEAKYALRCNELEVEVQRLRTSVSLCEADARERRTELERCEHLVSAYGEAQDAMVSELEALRLAGDTMRGAIEEMEEAQDDAERRAISAERNREALQERIDATIREANAVSEKRIADLSSALISREQELKNARHESTQLRASLEKATAAQSHADDEVRRVKSELQSVNDHERPQWRRVAVEAKEAQDRLVATSDELSRCQRALGVTEQKLKHLAQELHASEATTAALRVELVLRDESRQQVEAMEAQLLAVRHELAKRIKALVTERDSYRKRCEEQAEDIRAHGETIVTLRKLKAAADRRAAAHEAIDFVDAMRSPQGRAVDGLTVSV